MQDVTAFCLVLCRFGEYELHDLVELDQQTAGVLVQADAETCQVLTNRNAVSHPLPSWLFVPLLPAYHVL